MLQAWHEFYVLLGTAAAALVALLFVAASIGASYIAGGSGQPTRTFMSPVIVHYTAVLFFSLVALVPSQTDKFPAVIIGAVAAAGLGYSCFIFVRVLRSSAADAADRLGYGASPLVAYAGTLVSAGFLWTQMEVGTLILAASLVVLLIVNIRNAWDLTLTFARRRPDERPSA